jgi:hypothetical protein
LRLILRPTVRRPVRLGVGLTFGAHDEISMFLFLKNNFVSSSLSAHSLTRGRVCSLHCNYQRFESRRNCNHFNVSFGAPPTWRTRSSYLYSPGTGWPSYTPGHWVPFLSPLTTRRDYGGGILTRLHTGLERLNFT